MGCTLGKPRAAAKSSPSSTASTTLVAAAAVKELSEFYAAGLPRPSPVPGGPTAARRRHTCLFHGFSF